MFLSAFGCSGPSAGLQLPAGLNVICISLHKLHLPTCLCCQKVTSSAVKHEWPSLLLHLLMWHDALTCRQHGKTVGHWHSVKLHCAPNSSCLVHPTYFKCMPFPGPHWHADLSRCTLICFMLSKGCFASQPFASCPITDCWFAECHGTAEN